MLAEDLPPLKDIDFVQWVRVLQNLLENALLYAGEEKHPFVRARRHHRAPASRIWVEDEGPGHPGPTNREAVFEEVLPGTADEACKRPRAPALGLAIAREIVAIGPTAAPNSWLRTPAPHGAGTVIDASLRPRQEGGESEDGVTNSRKGLTRILLGVDDEEQIRRALKSGSMTSRGYALDVGQRPEMKP